MVSITTRGGSLAARIRRVASRPSTTGIRMSISTTSGRRAARRPRPPRRRPWPRPPRAGRPAASTIMRNPVRTRVWSSAIRTPRLTWSPAPRSAARTAIRKPDSSFALTSRRPSYSAARWATAASRSSRPETGASPLTSRPSRSWEASSRTAGRPAAAVARGLQRCLDHPVGDQVDTGGQLRRTRPNEATLAGPVRGSPPRVPGSSADTRLRRQRARVVVMAQDAQQSPQIAERVATGALDRQDRLAGALGIGAQQLPGTARLDDHRAHAVGDDVLELSADQCLFLGHGCAATGLDLGSRLLGQVAERVRAAGRLACQASQQPRPDPEHGGEDEVTDRCRRRVRIRSASASAWRRRCFRSRRRRGRGGGRAMPQLP